MGIVFSAISSLEMRMGLSVNKAEWWFVNYTDALRGALGVILMRSSAVKGSRRAKWRTGQKSQQIVPQPSDPEELL